MSTVLLVEDNEGDIALTRLAFKAGKLSSNLVVAYDGLEAIEYLSKQDETTLPKLILLDLNMPRMDGKKFLEVIKQDEKLKFIPVIMLTSSNASQDIQDCYRRYVNCYIVKPFQGAKLVQIMQQLEYFWINLAQLPSTVGHTSTKA